MGYWKYTRESGRYASYERAWMMPSLIAFRAPMTPPISDAVAVIPNAIGHDRHTTSSRRKFGNANSNPHPIKYVRPIAAMVPGTQIVKVSRNRRSRKYLIDAPSIFRTPNSCVFSITLK